MSESVASLTRPAWLPPTATGVRAVPCGRWFDAVVVDAFDAVCAIGLIQHRAGPAIEDQTKDTVTWLVPVRTADVWKLPGVDVLGAGREIQVPPARWKTTRRWLIEPPVAGDCLTSPELLYATLTEVLGTRRRSSRGPRHGA
ncbi:hypothetical protein [Streptomyces sp. B6B3]|uniref:hypothetical protein n=1 Tax=Streptomyces sp. B6B3 TaxID=3153570 RepID=UPI00325CBB3D